MIIFFIKKDTLQITAKNKQQSPTLRIPVESYIKLIWLNEYDDYSSIIQAFLECNAVFNYSHVPSRRQK